MYLAGISVSILIVYTCVSPIVGPRVFDSRFERQLDGFVRTTMGCQHVPGLVLTVVKEYASVVWDNCNSLEKESLERIQHEAARIVTGLTRSTSLRNLYKEIDNATCTKAYGFADFSTLRPVTKDTLFNIGSVTKSFTMALLGILLSERNLTWTSKVRDILGPGYEFQDEYRTREMTLKDLLSHRTGLARLDIGIIASYPSRTTRERLTRQVRFLPERKPFRDGYTYNNYMYMYLGHICEKLGGASWESLLKTRILTPLGMTSTEILNSPVDLLMADVAKPYIYKNGRFQDGTLNMYSISPVEPTGAILSSGKDMVKWMKFLLNKGKLNDGTQLVDRKLIEDAFKAITATNPEDFNAREYLTKPTWPIQMTTIGYGHGVYVSTYRGFRRLWHDGRILSYTSRMFLYPDRNTGVFVSTNGPGYMKFYNPRYPVKTVGYFASDGALGLKPWLNLSTTCTYPKPWATNVLNISPSNNSNPIIQNPYKYTGYYQHPFLPDIHIFEDRYDRTKLTFEMNRLSGVLHSTSETDEFKLETLQPWELTTENTNQNQSTVIFGRRGYQITNLTAEFEVNITYTKLLTYF